MESVKIGIFSDTHANLQALQAILKAFNELKVDKIYHCGDMICMGGNPRECVDWLLLTPNITLIRGNHDNDYLRDIRIKRTDSHVSSLHKEYTFNQLNDKIKEKISQMPFIIYCKEFNLKIAYLHYARANDRFIPIEHNPTSDKLDVIFSDINADILFYGHRHQPGEIIGNKIYIDIGSVGCHPEATASGIIFTVYPDNSYCINRINVPYNRQDAIIALQNKNIDGTQEIISNYFDCQPSI